MFRSGNIRTLFFITLGLLSVACALFDGRIPRIEPVEDDLSQPGLFEGRFAASTSGVTL